MYNSTTDVYATKRKTVNFSKSLVPKENRVEFKFVTQTIYGIFVSSEAQETSTSSQNLSHQSLKA